MVGEVSDHCDACPFASPACADCNYQGHVPGQTDLLEELEER